MFICEHKTKYYVMYSKYFTCTSFCHQENFHLELQGTVCNAYAISHVSWPSSQTISQEILNPSPLK